jgi:hypothetical protein
MPVKTEEISDIFTLYEQNIGMLTPLIADELKEARQKLFGSLDKRRHKGSCRIE